MPKNVSLLIVEQENEIRILLQNFLPGHGFRLFMADNFYQAIEVSRKCSIGLALVDVGMTDQDGVETFKALRQLNPTLRCCFMSGNPDPYGPTYLKKLGGAFLFKPFAIEVLAQTLRELWDSDSRPLPSILPLSDLSE
jgi:DNA-binding response OmpR family regulator